MAKDRQPVFPGRGNDPINGLLAVATPWSI